MCLIYPKCSIYTFQIFYQDDIQVYRIDSLENDSITGVRLFQENSICRRLNKVLSTKMNLTIRVL